MVDRSLSQLEPLQLPHSSREVDALRNFGRMILFISSKKIFDLVSERSLLQQIFESKGCQTPTSYESFLPGFTTAKTECVSDSTADSSGSALR